MDLSELAWFGLLFLFWALVAWEWELFDYGREKRRIERQKEIVRQALEHWNDAA